MATVTTLAGGASAGRTAAPVPYVVDKVIDFAAAATAKGSALAAADVIECISVPANTVILNAGFEVITVAGGSGFDWITCSEMSNALYCLSYSLNFLALRGSSQKSLEKVSTKPYWSLMGTPYGPSGGSAYTMKGLGALASISSVTSM